MKFTVDAQLPPGLAEWFRAEGHEAEHVEDIGLREASDETLWLHALRSGSVIVTKDEDFAFRVKQTSPAAPAIVWLRVGNSTNTSLRQWMEPRWPEIVRLLHEGNRLVEVR